jgi:two-component sensor histidine kinase
MHDADGVLIGYHGVIRDISERKKSEDALTRAFEERDALYRELQHRVKNSMAMIASLVGLEANRSEDNATRASLENIRDRVNSLAALYDILREAGNGNDVHLDEYLKKLVGSLEHAYLQEKSEVVLQVKADPVMLDARRAASFGLIVNELVTNSLKHGVKQGEAGIIRVELRLLCDEIALDVTDTGKGLPSGFDVTQAKGLGLQLVLMLVEQLGGFVTCETAEEARFHVRLPLNG